MKSSIDYFKDRFNEDWIVGADSNLYRETAKKRYQQLQNKTRSNPDCKILISESDPAKFLGSFIAASSAQCTLFLANPNWVESEWRYVLDAVQPQIVWGRELPANYKVRSTGNSRFPNPRTTVIAIPTGGTSGHIHFALHTWENFMASARGFSEYFQVKTINSCCMLPLYHVSGLMQFIRSLITGGKLWILPSKNIDFADDRKLPLQNLQWFISLVPTQLQRILQHPDLTQWLSNFHTVLLGGAPAWTQLLELARDKGIRLAPTYGMTETASQIVTLKPDDFLAGNNSCGRVLPHAQIWIESPMVTHSQTPGIIQIKTPSLAFGYYPHSPENPKPINFQNNLREMITDDVGFFDDRGYLHIVGRCSDKIITGGENVFPAEVESAIRASQLVTDVCVIGIPNTVWGQAVVAVYVPATPEITSDRLSLALEEKVAKFKRPKYWIPVDSLPRNDRGKVNRKSVLEIARSQVTEL